QATVLRSAGQMDKFGKKIDDSEESYRQALELDKNRGDAYYDLGLLYKDYRTNDPDQSKNIGQYRKARQFFQDYLARADKADPKREDAQGHIQDCDKYVEILTQAASSGSPPRRVAQSMNFASVCRKRFFWGTAANGGCRCLDKEHQHEADGPRLALRPCASGRRARPEGPQEARRQAR